MCLTSQTINRHTDFVAGSVSTHVQLIQLGTLFDNHGAHVEWLAKSTIDEIVTAYPRLGWNGALASGVPAQQLFGGALSFFFTFLSPS